MVMFYLEHNALVQGRLDRAEARLWCPLEAVVLRDSQLANFFFFSKNSEKTHDDKKYHNKNTTTGNFFEIPKYSGKNESNT